MIDIKTLKLYREFKLIKNYIDTEYSDDYFINDVNIINFFINNLEKLNNVCISQKSAFGFTITYTLYYKKSILFFFEELVNNNIIVDRIVMNNLIISKFNKERYLKNISRKKLRALEEIQY